jgi:hypothetical protein
MIPKIHARSRTGEVNTTATSILNDFSNRDFSADQYMTHQIEKLSGSNDLMTEALKEKAANSILRPLDEKRNDLLRVIFHEVNVKELWPDTPISMAASIISPELNKYGFEIINLAYATKSANINAMLQDLKKPEVSAAIASLQDLNILIDQLEIAQQEFENAFLKFVALKIEKEKLSSATKLSKVIRKQINNELIVYLSAMAMSMPDVYKDCAEVIATVIATNNHTVQTRIKKGGEEQSSD